MNIAIFANDFLPQFNGVVSYVLDVAEGLTKKGHKVILFVPRPKRGHKLNLREFPYRVIMVSSVPAMLYPDVRLTIPYLPRILYLLKKYKIQIIHTMEPLTLGTEGIMAAKILQLPIVITFHTFYMDEDILKHFRVGHRARKAIKTPLWKLTAYYHNLADAVVCPSIVSQNELEKHGLKKSTVLINNGIDLKKTKTLTSQEKVNLREKFGIKKGAMIGLYTGRLSIDKSVDKLIYIWKKVVKENSGAVLVIIGGGPEKIKLTDLVHDLNLEKNVLFLGVFSRNEIIKQGLYCLGDVFVTASKIENQSISMLEAMAHSLPIVGVNVRGTPELADASNSIIVEPDDIDGFSKAVIKLFNDEALRKKLSVGSFKKAEVYNIDTTVKKLEALYRVLIKFKTV